jgi:hypothetical protein
MNSNTNIFYEQQLLAMKLADIFQADVKKKDSSKEEMHIPNN